MSQNQLKILCIEDDKDTCELLTFVLDQAGYEVTSCTQKDCLELIHKEKFLAIILDNYFDGLRGTDICQEIRAIDQTIPVIFFSGEVRQTEIEKAMSVGASAYLLKPQDFEKLVPTAIKLINESQSSL